MRPVLYPPTPCRDHPTFLTARCSLSGTDRFSPALRRRGVPHACGEAPPRFPNRRMSSRRAEREEGLIVAAGLGGRRGHRGVCNKQGFVLGSGSFGPRHSLASLWLGRREASAFRLHRRASTRSQNFGMW